MLTRLDQWLWAVRLFKTRACAAAACRDGGVQIGGQRVKPARDARVGDLITAKIGTLLRTVKVVGHPPGRVGAKLVPQFLEDLTPASEYEKARAPKPAGLLLWGQGQGRPTKKNRRMLEKFGDPEF